VFQRDAALARQDEAASLPEPAAPALAAGDEVTLLVVRAGSPLEANDLRQRIQAALPNGATVSAVQVSRDAAAELLRRR
jgi:hypothetical protein